MGRFHVCMPVAAGDGYCCALCRQDMSWEMSQYAAEVPAWWEPQSSVAPDPNAVLNGCAAGDGPRTP